MSIIQVLVGFGLASILGLVLAEMNSSSSKQMGQMRLQFERAAVIQSLQSAISNSQVCPKFLDMSKAFGPTVTDNIPKTGLTTIKANWFYMGLNQTQPIIEGQQIPNTSLKVDWIRAVSPTLVNVPIPGSSDKVYMADLQIKLSPVTANAAADNRIDLRSMTVGKVYFVTTGLMPTGLVKSCYGDAAGSYLCPTANDIQVMSSGSWVCSSLQKALGPVCGSGQLIQSSGSSSNVTCVQTYNTVAGCGSGVTLSPTCMTNVCGTASSSGSSSGTINNISITVPSLDISGNSFGGANVVTDTSCTTTGGSSGTGSMPGSSGSTSCSSSKIFIPALGGGNNHTVAKAISGGSGTFTVTTGSSSPLYRDCNGACNQTASKSCNNTPR